MGGQCRKSSAKDIEKSKESARRRKTLEKKFQESAALRLQKRYRSKKRIDRFADAAGDMLSKEQTRKSQEKAAKIAEEIRIANLKEEAKKLAKKKKFQESAALRLQKRYRSKKRIDRFADAAGDMLSK